MPLTAILPLFASLLGLAAGVIAIGFARAPGWEAFRSAAWPAFFASVYCVGDLVLAYPSIGQYAPVLAPFQVTAVGGYLASLGWYLPAVAGAHRLDRVVRGWGIVIVLSGVVALVPDLAFASVAAHREVAWLNATYTEASANLGGQLIMAFALIGLTLPIARAVGDMRAGHPSGRLHVVGFSVLFVTGATDIATNAQRIPAPYIFSAGFVMTLAYGARAIFARFADHAADLDARSSSLAGLIDERTQELARAKDQLHRAEKLAALGQLAAGVAHEVNNPSAAVVANLHYVLDAHERAGEFPPDAVTALKESLTAMGRVARIVRQLLDAGRAGARHEVLESVSLDRAVEGALAIVRPLVPGHVTVRSTVGAHLSVRAREDLLVQALVNLVTNAVQAVPLDAQGRVTISAKPKGERVLLVVEDDGMGMNTEVRGRIFEPFFTTKAPGIGTGLGLAVTLGIIRSLGGEVTVESARGVGTRVCLDLQRADTTGTLAIAVPRPAVPDAPRLRILVIDDERSVRDALRRMLKRTYDVRVAGDVKEALSELHARPNVDVVLCDVLMADGGGEHVYRTLRVRAPELARRVIFLTGGAPDAARAFLESQPQPVLEKPLDVAVLAATIAKLRAEPPGAPTPTGAPDGRA